jgi:hypothetical protein
MSVATVTNTAGLADDYQQIGVTRSGAGDLPTMASSTRLVSRVFDRFQLVLLPFAAAAAMASPSSTSEIRTFSARAAGSLTRRIEAGWWVDDWAYTTESARLDDVAALNRLLALPAVEGLVLDYPDD